MVGERRKQDELGANMADARWKVVAADPNPIRPSMVTDGSKVCLLVLPPATDAAWKEARRPSPTHRTQWFSYNFMKCAKKLLRADAIDR